MGDEAVNSSAQAGKSLFQAVKQNIFPREKNSQLMEIGGFGLTRK